MLESDYCPIYLQIGNLLQNIENGRKTFYTEKSELLEVNNFSSPHKNVIKRKILYL